MVKIHLKVNLKDENLMMNQKIEKEIGSNMKMILFDEEVMSISDLVEVFFSNLKLCERLNPLSNTRDRDDQSEISDNESELNETLNAIKTRSFSGYHTMDNHEEVNKKSFAIFASRTEQMNQREDMFNDISLIPDLNSYHFINTSTTFMEDIDLDMEYRHDDNFNAKKTLQIYAELKFKEAARIVKTRAQEIERQDELDKLDSSKEIPRIKWNFGYDLISQGALQNDYFQILSGFQKMKQILLDNIDKSNLSLKTTELLTKLVISEFKNMDYNVIYSLLVATEGWYFQHLKYRMVDRINQYMMYYTNQEINMIWIFAQEIWKYDSEFLNPFLEKKSISIRDLFSKWLEVALLKFHMFPLDSMKMDTLTESTLTNSFKKIFENLVYPLQEACQTNYEKLVKSDKYYVKLNTIDRLTHMKDELEYEFHKMKKSIENIFLRARPELVEYGTQFFEVYKEKTQQFFPVNDFLDENNNINLERFYKILSYFRMIPDDFINEKVWVNNFPLKLEEITEEKIKLDDDSKNTPDTDSDQPNTDPNSQSTELNEQSTDSDQESEDELIKVDVDDMRLLILNMNYIYHKGLGMGVLKWYKLRKNPNLNKKSDKETYIEILNEINKAKNPSDDKNTDETFDFYDFDSPNGGNGLIITNKDTSPNPTENVSGGGNVDSTHNEMI
jgi:hypothetical protein